jgi:hypothetical protein
MFRMTLTAGLMMWGGWALAQDATFQTKSLTPETALVAAKAAMESCRSKGYQVAVAIVDRGGLTQVLLRDRFAGRTLSKLQRTRHGLPPVCG